VRATFFSLLPLAEGVYFFLRLSASSAPLYFLEEVPSLLYLLLSTQQVLGWARSYHMMRGEEATYSRVVRRVALWGVGGVAALQGAIYVAYFTTRGAVDPDLWSLLAALLHMAAFSAAAAALCGYGFALRRALRATPLPLAARESQRRTFALVNALVAAAFLLRVLALAGASWADYADFDEVRERFKPEDAAASAAFFCLTEALPMAVLLWSNRASRGGGGGGEGAGSGARGASQSQLSPRGGGGGGGGAPPERRALSPAAARALAFSQSPRKSSPPPAVASTGSVLLGLGGMVFAALAPSRGGDERASLLGGGGGAAAGGGSGGSAAAGYGSGQDRDIRSAIAASAAMAAAPRAPSPPGGAGGRGLEEARAAAAAAERRAGAP
jgi:hypothetical protein